MRIDSSSRKMRRAPWTQPGRKSGTSYLCVPLRGKLSEAGSRRRVESQAGMSGSPGQIAMWSCIRGCFVRRKQTRAVRHSSTRTNGRIFIVLPHFVTVVNQRTCLTAGFSARFPLRDAIRKIAPVSLPVGSFLYLIRGTRPPSEADRV